MKNVVAYCRVSTDGQTGEDKFGIESQKQQIMEYCQKNDMQISDWFIDEGVSGVKEDRPAFDKILFDDGVKNPPVECVVVAKSDRIAREIKLYFYYEMLLQKKGIELISVSEDFGEFGAFAPMLKAFTMIIAEQERININKRTSFGRGVKSRSGGYSGGKAPYGYVVRNKRLEINEPEAAVVRLVFSERDKDNTLNTICNFLNDQGYKSRKGGPFYISNVQSILGNKNTYLGMYKYGKSDQWVEGQQEAILTGE